jgi:pyruvate dehydrogenase (quinone)
MRLRGSSTKDATLRTSCAKNFLEHDNPFYVGMTGVLFDRRGLPRPESVHDVLGCDFAW